MPKQKKIQILVTREYELFDPDADNRPTGNRPKLKASMEAHGWLSAYPMHVVQNGGRRFKIKDGHNRYFYAKELGIPVKYVVDKNIDIVDLQDTQAKWGLSDYLHCFSARNNPHYIRLGVFIQRSRLPMTSAIILMGGGSSACGQNIDKFRRGKFTVRRGATFTNAVAEAAHAISDNCPDVGIRQAIIFALIKVYQVPGLNHAQMIAKISRWGRSQIVPMAQADQYIPLIEKTYNFHGPKKKYLNIALMVADGARDRKAVGRPASSKKNNPISYADASEVRAAKK